MITLSVSARCKMFLPLLAILALVCPLLSGCGKGKNKAQVSGKVFYKGQPMAGGMLFFNAVDSKDNDKGKTQPANNPQIPAGAPVPNAAAPAPKVGAVLPGQPVSINADGTFNATGLPTGKMKILVQSGREAEKYPDSPDGKPVNQPADTGVKAVEIPEKYTSVTETPLEWDLTPGKNQKDLKVD